MTSADLEGGGLAGCSTHGSIGMSVWPGLEGFQTLR